MMMMLFGVSLPYIAQEEVWEGGWEGCLFFCMAVLLMRPQTQSDLPYGNAAHTPRPGPGPDPGMLLHACQAAVYKGFHIPRCVASWVLGLVHATAARPQRDARHAMDTFDLNAVSKGLKDPACKSLVYSLIFRRDYKCLGGDKKMFNACAHDWLGRFKSVEVNPALSSSAAVHAAIRWDITPIDVSAVKPSRLTIDRWCLAAVDFHCTNIDEKLAARVGVDRDRLRSIIWACSSSQTNKSVVAFADASKVASISQCSSDDRQLWARLELQFSQIAASMLKAKTSQPLWGS